ncbi:MAG: hypothetical protein IT374_08265 [Polyangiaceae bacterium]|nr:hypothetical protein [Polyangiaceae bacterium]
MSSPRTQTIPGVAPPPRPRRASPTTRHELLGALERGATWSERARRAWLERALSDVAEPAPLVPCTDAAWLHALEQLRRRLDDLIAGREGFVHGLVYRGVVARERGAWRIRSREVHDAAGALVAALARDVLTSRGAYDDELCACAACGRHRFVTPRERATRACRCGGRGEASSARC